LALTAAYAVSGKLALLLAVPPGYASPVFPPAGIAVAAMLTGGPATLPWTFLGSLALNVWTGYSAAHTIGAAGLGAAIAIAGASTLQAAAGGAVLRRAVGSPAPLDNGRDLTRFLLLSPAFWPNQRDPLHGQPSAARCREAAGPARQLGFVVDR